MSDAWIAFARTGNPNHPGMPTWPTYDAKTRATMVFDVTSQVINDPRTAERKVWEGRDPVR
jgi:para-nitrobenzyl esterase